MVAQLLTYHDSFRFFKAHAYKTNEYYLKAKSLGVKDFKKVPTKFLHTFAIENLILETKDLGNHQARTVVKKKAIDRFHPNNINNKNFWSTSRELFPLLSVCGAESKNIQHVNRQTLGMSRNMGLLGFLNKFIADSPEKPTILEIGFGYGSLFFEIKDKCNYVGIDYVIHKSLQKYGNFIEIDETGIPDYLLNENYVDVIYCVNVLQHCSQQDRFKYFRQGYDALKRGGYFLFTQFIMTEKNKNDICWGVVDERGRGYTHFFNQLTECDWDYELYAELNKIGYEIIESVIGGNSLAMLIRKK